MLVIDLSIDMAHCLSHALADYRQFFRNKLSIATNHIAYPSEILSD